ncbi:MAG: class I SAM-dependent methyltransferase [Bdellovibrionales bacterium]|nr:class I SAM-dependent methyltransferase [Bdellovibrionales bacterium]
MTRLQSDIELDSKAGANVAKRVFKKAEQEPIFDKYHYYRRAVQSPDIDVKFLRDTYRELKGEEPTALREDFCGTFAISCEWAKLSPRYRAYGVDVDDEPILYGLSNNLSKLPKGTRDRVKIQQADVLNPGLPKADIVAAMNFSHYVFKDRAMMKSYFHNANSTLNVGGLFIIDCFGGPSCQHPTKEETDHKDFTYVWEQVSFDPVSSEALFQIHFRLKGAGGKVRRHNNVFTYDWRMWSIPELREMMMETGFRKTHVYWEGTTRDGEGDGIFSRVERGEDCEAWVAYVVGEK